MAEPIGALRVELEASSAKFEADMGKVRDSLKKVGGSFGAMGKEVEISRRTLSAVGTEVRFAASHFISRLDPALSGTVAQFTSLASVAAATGGTLGAIAGTAGVGALIVALGGLVTEMIKTEQAAEELRKAFKDWDLEKMEDGVHALTLELTRLEDVQAGLVKPGWLEWLLQAGVAMEGVSVEGVTFADRITEIKKRIDEMRQSLVEAQKQDREHTKDLQDKEAATKAYNDLLEDMARLERAATEAAAQRDQSRIDQMMTRGKQIFADTRTEVEKFADSLQELNRLYMFGAIDVETYNRAVEKLDAAQIEPMVTKARAIFQETRTEAERFQASLEELADLYRRGAIDLDTYNRRVEQLEHGWSRAVGTGDDLKKTQEDINIVTAVFAVEAASGFAHAIVSAENFTDAMKNLAVQLAETLLQAIFLSTILGSFGVPSGQMGGIAGGIGKLLGFQQGGVVPGPIGQPRLAMVHGGEVITPPDEPAAGGPPIVVQNHFHPGLPETVRREVWNMMPMIVDQSVAGVIGASDRGGRMSRVMGRRGTR